MSSPVPPKSPTINYQCTVEPPTSALNRKQNYYHNNSPIINSPITNSSISNSTIANSSMANSSKGNSSMGNSSSKSPISKSPIAKSPIAKSPISKTAIYNNGSSVQQQQQKSPNYSRSPVPERTIFSQSGGNKSPNVKLSSPNQTEHVFDFCQQKSPKSPRSPRVNYSDDIPSSPPIPEEDYYFNFDLKSPPKSKLSKYHRQQFQSSKTDSMSSKSSLEYKSTTKHPNGDYQDIEYKICNSSIDSDSQQSSSDYQHQPNRSRHLSFKEKKRNKPQCNIRTNPGYDERYSSSKSINEYCGHTNHSILQRCRKSTSDLTDLTDDAGNTTTMTSLSRPSSPRRKGSVKGGLAYLASRRSSRDSIASNMSNVSNEDIGPLNFQNTTRGRQRRTSNFLELPGENTTLKLICYLKKISRNMFGTYSCMNQSMFHEL